jgi:hypothetical protein
VSTGQPTLVPIDFEDYLAAEHAIPVTRQPCEGCYRTDLSCWQIGRPGTSRIYCEVCAHRYHACDIEEQRMVHALIGGVVRAALDHDVSASLIRAAVDRAIDERVEAEVAALREALVGAQCPADKIATALDEADKALRS